MTAPIMHPGDVDQGPVRPVSSQAGLAAVKYGPKIPSTGVVTDHAPAPVDAPTPDHGPLAASLSDRTLAKVLSRPAYVPSIVMLDREEAQQERTQAYERVMGAALEWEYADAYPDSSAAMDTTEALDALRTAIRAYKAVAR